MNAGATKDTSDSAHAKRRTFRSAVIAWGMREELSAGAGRTLCTAHRRGLGLARRLALQALGAQPLHIGVKRGLGMLVLGHGLFGVLLTHQVTFSPLRGREPVRYCLLIGHGEITRGSRKGSIITRGDAGTAPYARSEHGTLSPALSSKREAKLR